MPYHPLLYSEKLYIETFFVVNLFVRFKDIYCDMNVQSEKLKKNDLERPISDWVPTAPTLGQDSICVAVLTIWPPVLKVTYAFVSKRLERGGPC